MKILIIWNIYNKMGIMKKKIKIAELLSTDVRSRSNAEKIRGEIKKNSKEVVLDFSGVTFISRSFTDELYTVISVCKNKHIDLINTSDVVASMLKAVKSGREKKRVRPNNDSEIKEFDDMESLSHYLSTIG